MKEESNWKWGIFYFNRDDKRIMVPKKNQMGLTFNFAHPVAVAVFCLAIVVILLDLLV